MSVRRVFFGLVALSILISVIVTHYRLQTVQENSDFEVYHRTAVRFSEARWAEIYNYRLDGASPFRYPPASLPLLKPLSWMDYQTAKIVWFYIQILFLFGGFFYLYKTIQLFKRDAALICSLLFLCTLRFSLAGFTWGQVFSLLFFGLAGSLYYWLKRQGARAGGLLLIPAMLKIFPGFLYALLVKGGARFMMRALGTSLFLILGLGVGVLISAGSFQNYFELWRNWLEVVFHDAHYFDASIYSSQSLNSFLLRLSRWGLLSYESARSLYLILSGLLCAGVALFWFLRSPRSPLGKMYFFSLGIFPFLWCMPETFKYTFIVLAIPVAGLLCGELGRLDWFALGFSLLTLSIPGLDVVGRPVFTFLQVYSIPLLATGILAIAVLRHALQESEAVFRCKRAIP